MHLVKKHIDSNMEEITEVRSETKFNQKNMLKAKRHVEDMAIKIKGSEGKNVKEITSLKESFANIL